jgi:hypothetical protein
MISLGLRFCLCMFHAMMAVIDYSDQKLRVRDPSTLVAIVLIFKWVRGGRTIDAVKQRWDQCKENVLPELEHLSHHVAIRDGDVETQMTAREALIRFMECEWLSERWRLAWTLAGRMQRVDGSIAPDWWLYWIWTNNGVERFWIDVICWLCNHKQFKRIDTQAVTMTGVSHDGIERSSFFDKVDLKARDFLTKPTVIPSDVRLRLMLALLLIVRGAVTLAADLSDATVHLVQRGQAYAKSFQFGYHALRRRPAEFRMTATTSAALTPLRESMRQSFGVPDDTGYDVYCVDAEKLLC